MDPAELDLRVPLTLPVGRLTVGAAQQMVRVQALRRRLQPFSRFEAATWLHGSAMGRIGKLDHHSYRTSNTRL